MIVGSDVTRRATAGEHDEIDALLVAAFGRRDEADLVRRLRSDGAMWIETVVPWQGRIAGYAALSRMRAPAGWACLAPLAVLPRLQRGAAAPSPSLRHAYGIGTRLVAQIAEAVACGAPQSGPSTVVVLGEPDFYRRAGFSSERARNLTSPYPIEFTLIARPSDDAPTERLAYPLAFDGLA